MCRASSRFECAAPVASPTTVGAPVAAPVAAPQAAPQATPVAAPVDAPVAAPVDVQIVCDACADACTLPGTCTANGCEYGTCDRDLICRIPSADAPVDCTDPTGPCEARQGREDARELDAPKYCNQLPATVAGGCLAWFHTTRDPGSFKLCLEPAAGNSMCRASSRFECVTTPAPSPAPTPSPTWMPVSRMVLDGGDDRFPAETCVSDPTATHAHGSVIGVQCCDLSSNGLGDLFANEGCHRYFGTQDDAGCIAGRPARPLTYAEAVQVCEQLSLSLCDRPCAGKGCGLNSHPVWSSMDCDVTFLQGVLARRASRTPASAPSHSLVLPFPCLCSALLSTPAPRSWQALDGGRGNHPAETCITNLAETTMVGDSGIIAAQCCAESAGGAAVAAHNCRRWTGTNDEDGCFGGSSPPTPTTYLETVALCEAAGLDLCQQSCRGTGCEYNSWPGAQHCTAAARARARARAGPSRLTPRLTRAVWTKLPCSIQAAPTPAPTLYAGALVSHLVVDGGGQLYAPETCVSDPEKTEVYGATIATQCCVPDQAGASACRRAIGSRDDEGCVGGKPPRAYTFAQAEALCAELDLELCSGSCQGKGCGYDKLPVWTKRECQSTGAPTAAPSVTSATGAHLVIDGSDRPTVPDACVADDVTRNGGRDIAAQCCDPDDNTDAGCRRWIGNEANCIGRGLTHAENAEVCEANMLEMCFRSCKGTGCGSNRYPVRTGTPCALTITPTPAPSQAPTQSGNWVLDGGDGDYPQRTCVAPTATEVHGTTIIAQCCVPDMGPRRASCRRYMGDDVDDDCIGGKPPRPYTHTQAAELCAELDLELCSHSCKNAGCQYNQGVVWTKDPCEVGP